MLGLMPRCEPFPAAPVLEELDGELGAVVWLSLRAVDLWRETEPALHDTLFCAGAAESRAARLEALEPLDPQAREALHVLAGVLGPEPAEAGQVAWGCAALARWAGGAGFPRTAFEAAARAALAEPENAGYALLAGRTARSAADHPRATAWLQRAIRLAGRAGDGVSHANALLALAQVHMVRYERAAAEQVLHQAIRSARRHAVWDVKPKAYHDLFCIQCTDGTVRTAAAYALAAAEGYGEHHERLLPLAHDVALFLAIQGRPDRSLALAEALAPRMPNPRFRLAAFSSLGRIAGAAGDRARFADAWAAVWGMLDPLHSDEGAAEALVSLAWGAAHLRDRERVEVAAREALRIAAARQEGQEILAAGEMLRCLEEGTLPQSPPLAAGSDEDLRDALAAAELLLGQLLRTPALRRAGIEPELVAEPPAA